MPNLRAAVFLVSLAFLGASCGNAGAQKVDTSSTGIQQQLLSLNVANRGQHLSATVGQQLELTLGTVGPKYYGTPQVSSPAIRLEGVELAGPQNPGGATYVYFFEAIAEGEAQIKIPIIFPFGRDLCAASGEIPGPSRSSAQCCQWQYRICR